MGKVNFPKLLGKLDLLDGIKDRQYSGLQLLMEPDGTGHLQKTTTGACSVQKGEGTVAFWNEEGTRTYDCQNLARQLNELVDLEMQNPVWMTLMNKPLPEGVQIFKTHFEQYEVFHQAIIGLLTAQISLQPTLSDLLAQINIAIPTVSFSEGEKKLPITVGEDNPDDPRVN